MFLWRFKDNSGGGIHDWLVENKQQVLAGTAEYRGTRVNEATEFHQFQYVVSLGTVTLLFRSPYLLPAPENGFLRFTRWKYVLISMLFGWWCFPWGPPFVIHSVVSNLRGGHKRTATSLLQLVEWGWDAPSDALASAHNKQLVQVSPSAAAEIRSRMERGGFSDELAVRVTSTRTSEVTIAFDYPVSGGQDWVDDVDGLRLLIDKRDEQKLAGCMIDWRDAKFVAVPP